MIGKKPLPTKRDLAQDTASSLSSMFGLSYEQQRWVETTANLITSTPEALAKFLKDDPSIFQGPQFRQLGGISALRNFENRNLVFDSLKSSVLVQQATKGAI